MAEEKMSMVEFRERVVALMISTYAQGYDEAEIRAAVEECDMAIKDGYNLEYGIESGIRYAADNISMMCF